MVIKGWNPRKAIQLCKIQDVMGEHFIWEVPRSKNSRAVNSTMNSIAGEGILMGKSKVWTNSPEVRSAIVEEEEKAGWIEKLRKGKREARKSQYSELVKKGIEEQMEKRETNIGAVEESMKTSRGAGILIVEDPRKEMEIFYVDGWGRYFDEVSGKELEAKGVTKARVEEMIEVAKHRVYDKVPIAQCYEDTGAAPIKVRWLDINKGDELSPEYRSRLVAMEIKKDNRKDLFAPTPPLEAKKILFAMAVTEGYGFEEGKEKEGMILDFIDVRRAFFHADCIGKVYVQLCEEDWEEGMCGKLNKAMYGTRDAAQNWAEAYMGFMVKSGFTRGRASPCVFWHKERNIRAVVHGDDFNVLGMYWELDWFWKTIQERFECKKRGRLGPEEGDEKSIRILNRIVTWTEEGIQYEGDQRHVEIACEAVGFNDKTKSVVTPAEKSKLEDEKLEMLDKKESTKYRGLVARFNYLGQDRSDIQYAVKTLGSAMANPTNEDMGKVKRCIRYLLGVPRCIVPFRYQKKTDTILAWSDSDFAGCTKSRKSTSGGVILFGGCIIKSYSSTQAVRALSSGEAEYYALVKAACGSMGIRALLGDLGVDCSEIVINTDASAAMGVAQRLGIGKIRHIEVNQLWLQEKVYSGEIRLVKVGTDENLADALTKPVGAADIYKHAEGLGYEMRQDRHPLAPSIDRMSDEGREEDEGEDEEEREDE